MTSVPEERISEEIQSAIKVDGDAVRGHLDELVRTTVEETPTNSNRPRGVLEIGQAGKSAATSTCGCNQPVYSAGLQRLAIEQTPKSALALEH